MNFLDSLVDKAKISTLEEVIRNLEAELYVQRSENYELRNRLHFIQSEQYYNRANNMAGAGGTFGAGGTAGSNGGGGISASVAAGWINANGTGGGSASYNGKKDYGRIDYWLDTTFD